jgi:ABC-type transport system involved in multi-copper enzyme maturation permease subunit
MAMHDLGYRSWDAHAPYQKYSWLSISRYGVRLAWKSHWLRRIVFLAFMPVALMVGAVFFFEQASNTPAIFPAVVTVVEFLETNDGQSADGDFQQPYQRMADRAAFLRTRDPEKIASYLSEHRPRVWKDILFFFFKNSQGPTLVILIGMIAPGLISRDMQSRAFLLYLSRPITPFQYALGKATTVWVFVASVSTIPALAVYFIGVLFSPNLGVLLNTWDIPLRILLASGVLAIPTTALALCLSSIVHESRYAGFSWYAIWIVGAVATNILTGIAIAEDPQNISVFARSAWSWLSLYHVLGIVEQWVFGLMAKPTDVIPYLTILVVLTIVCFSILMRRITAPIRI